MRRHLGPIFSHQNKPAISWLCSPGEAVYQREEKPDRCRSNEFRSHPEPPRDQKPSSSEDGAAFAVRVDRKRDAKVGGWIKTFRNMAFEDRSSSADPGKWTL